MLVSGPLPPNPAELTGSVSLRNVFTAAREDHRTVVVVGTDLDTSDDAVRLAMSADGALVVVRRNRGSQQQLRSAVRSITSSGGRVFGVVLGEAPADAAPAGLPVAATGAGAAAAPSHDAGPDAWAIRETPEHPEPFWVGDTAGATEPPPAAQADPEPYAVDAGEPTAFMSRDEVLAVQQPAPADEVEPEPLPLLEPEPEPVAEPSRSLDLRPSPLPSRFPGRTPTSRPHRPPRRASPTTWTRPSRGRPPRPGRRRRSSPTSPAPRPRSRPRRRGTRRPPTAPTAPTVPTAPVAPSCPSRRAVSCRTRRSCRPPRRSSPSPRTTSRSPPSPRSPSRSSRPSRSWTGRSRTSRSRSRPAPSTRSPAARGEPVPLQPVAEEQPATVDDPALAESPVEEVAPDDDGFESSFDATFEALPTTEPTPVTEAAQPEPEPEIEDWAARAIEPEPADEAPGAEAGSEPVGPEATYSPYRTPDPVEDWADRRDSLADDLVASEPEPVTDGTAAEAQADPAAEPLATEPAAAAPDTSWAPAYAVRPPAAPAADLGADDAPAPADEPDAQPAGDPAPNAAEAEPETAPETAEVTSPYWPTPIADEPPPVEPAVDVLPETETEPEVEAEPEAEAEAAPEADVARNKPPFEPGPTVDVPDDPDNPSIAQRVAMTLRSLEPEAESTSVFGSRWRTAGDWASEPAPPTTPPTTPRSTARPTADRRTRHRRRPGSAEEPSAPTRSAYESFLADDPSTQAMPAVSTDDEATATTFPAYESTTSEGPGTAEPDAGEAQGADPVAAEGAGLEATGETTPSEWLSRFTPATDPLSDDYAPEEVDHDVATPAFHQTASELEDTQAGPPPFGGADDVAAGTAYLDEPEDVDDVDDVEPDDAPRSGSLLDDFLTDEDDDDLEPDEADEADGAAEPQERGSMWRPSRWIDR